MRRATPIFIALLLPLVAGCHDYGIFGPGYRDFEGYYTYVGVVENQFGHTVAGEVVVSRQYGDRADVAIDWTYYDRGEPLFRIRTDRPAVADIDRDGDIRFDFEGNLSLYGQRVWFRLTHDGYLSGRTIRGDWRLRTDLPTTDYGSFEARR